MNLKIAINKQTKSRIRPIIVENKLMVVRRERNGGWAKYVKDSGR